MPSLSGAAAVSAILIAIVVISIESRAGNNAVTRQAVRFPVLSAATKASRISISDGGDSNMTQTQAPRGHTEQEQLESPMPTHPPRTSPPPPEAHSTTDLTADVNASTAAWCAQVTTSRRARTRVENSQGRVANVRVLLECQHLRPPTAPPCAPACISPLKSRCRAPAPVVHSLTVHAPNR